MEEQRVYKVYIKCLNCGYGEFPHEELEILKGTKVCECICPRCKCQTIVMA